MDLQPGSRSSALAIFAGVLVAALGFGVLNVFYWTSSSASVGPGLYGYLSSSIGDALLLPTAAWALVRIAAAPGVAVRLRWQVAGGVLGFGVGAGLVGMWLADPDPIVNWTLPSAGRLNAAGWYHAAFMCCAMGFFGVLLARGIAWYGPRLRDLGYYRLQVWVFIGSFTLFGLLLAVDNLMRRGSLGVVSTDATLGAALAVAIVLGVCVHRPYRRGIRAREHQ